ncbi:unnamed protein product, partial [Durusdinium trenchii]
HMWLCRDLWVNPCLGLSETIARQLQRELPKEQQCSDWSLRPLTPEQRRYAALDAHALLLLLAAQLDERSMSTKDLAHCFLGHAEQLKALAQPCFVPFGPEHVDEAIAQLKLPIREATPGSSCAIHCKTLGIVGALPGHFGQTQRAVVVLGAQRQSGMWLEAPKAPAARATLGASCLPMLWMVSGLEVQLSLSKAAKALGWPQARLAKRRDLPKLFGFEAGGTEVHLVFALAARCFWTRH